MKTLGGPRRNMDPIDAYRLEQEKKRARQNDQAAKQGQAVDGYRISGMNNKASGGKLAGLFGVLALVSFAATFILGFAGEFLPPGYEWLLPAMFRHNTSSPAASPYACARHCPDRSARASPSRRRAPPGYTAGTCADRTREARSA